MTMIEISHEPRVYHHNMAERPEDSTERHELIAKAVENVANRTAGNLDTRYLCYLSDLPDGIPTNANDLKNQVGENLERVRPRLIRVGFISFLPYHSFVIDWHHIRAVATYINAEKTASWDEIEAEQVEPGRKMSIMAELKKADKFVQRADGAFGTIQDMSEDELSDLLDHMTFLQGG